MKTLLIAFFSLLMAKGCSGDVRQDLREATVEYTANNRGFFRKITLKDQQAVVSKDRENPDTGETIRISDADWKALVAEFGKVKLEDIPNMKDPTQKRFYDGAAMANVKVTYKGKTYESKTFDHLEPPHELAGVVNRLIELTLKNEE